MSEWVEVGLAITGFFTVLPLVRWFAYGMHEGTLRESFAWVGYWRSVAGRAFWDTLALFGWHHPWRVFIPTAIAGFFFLALWRTTLSDPDGEGLVMEEFVVWQATLMAIGATFLLVFAIRLVATPASLERERAVEQQHLVPARHTESSGPSIDSILERAAPLVELAIDRYRFEELGSSKEFARTLGRTVGRHRARSKYQEAMKELRTLGYRCDETRRSMIDEFIGGIEEVAYSEDFSKSVGEQRKLAMAVYDEFKQQIDATA